MPQTNFDSTSTLIKEAPFSSVDQTNIKTIDTALAQATEKDNAEQVRNLRIMRKLVGDFPGQAVVRTNDLSQSEGIVDTATQDVILHMAEGHRFIYHNDQLNYDSSESNQSATGLPLLSMRHGVVLAFNSTHSNGTDIPLQVNIFDYDIPTALTSAPQVPESGIKVKTTKYRTQPGPNTTHEIGFGKVDPRKNDPLEFLRCSLDPKKKF